MRRAWCSQISASQPLLHLRSAPVLHRKISCRRMSSQSEHAEPSQEESSDSAEHVKEAIAAVRTRIKDAVAKRGKGETQLIAVSKTKPVSDLMAAYATGQRLFGENYVQELIDKAPQMPDDVQWHFIGTVQSNKAKSLVGEVPNLYAVETVDSEKLANKLNSACENAGREQPLTVYIQVDTSGEETKSGVAIEGNELVDLARYITESCKHLKLVGLMTIGAPEDMSCFDKLVDCRQKLSEALEVSPESLELSMGMSGDFEQAIARGSTSVRVGSTIFGARNYKKKK